jgi:hypothetical protein
MHAGVQGYLDAELAVSSYHVVEGLYGRVLRVLYGEGERLFCWIDVATEAIVWHALAAPRSLPTSSGSEGSMRMRFKASGSVSR